MKKWISFTLICSFILVLSGCWDQRYFKEVKLALASGFDLTNGGKLMTTASLPNIEKSSQGPGIEMTQIVTVIADTPRQSRVKIDREISKTFDSSKMRVLLFGSKLAKRGVYPLLDVFYRDPSSPLNMDLGVVQGKAENAITLKVPGEARPSEYLSGILDSAARSTLIGREETVQGIASKLLDPGKDAVLPYMVVNKKKGIVDVDGLALFNGDKYTGQHLNSDQSTLFSLMNNQRGNIARLTEKVHKGAKNPFDDFITIEVKSQNVKKKIFVGKTGELSATLNLKLNVRVIEYAKDKLYKPKNVEMLNKKLSKILTEKAKGVVQKLQKADCDGFSLGRQVLAYHRSMWGKLDWNETYAKMKITPKVTVHILQHGILE